LEPKVLFIHKDLVEKSKKNDRSAQYRLYELYVDAMFNIGIRMLSSKEDAEDVVQESFVHAFKNLHSFRYESTFGAWLKRIVVNRSINFLKLKKIDIAPIEDHDYYLKEESIEQVSTTDIQKVKKGIELLPNGYKQIINLYLIDGYDHIEISEILGISNSTSKSQYHRAKKKLIEIIHEL